MSLCSIFLDKFLRPNRGLSDEELSFGSQEMEMSWEDSNRSHISL